jgi:quercetin dioxygenase-like cupin family protein
MGARYEAARISDIRSPIPREPGSYEWKPVRQHFGVQSFGVNLMVAPEAGDWVVEEHTEVADSDTRHEELFFVSAGHARFVVDGEEVDAPAGTFVHVPDPEARRGARAVEPGTTVLAIGAEPGAAFTPSQWELRYFE